MASILRTCIHRQNRLCFEQLIVLGRNVTRNSTIKRFTPVSQVKRYSTESEQKNESLKLIYQGNLATRILHVRLFSLMTSFGSVMVQPYICMKAYTSDNLMAIMGVIPLFLIFGIGTPVLLHFITRSYVIDMYYNSLEDKYIAKTYTFFARTRTMEFKPKDVTIPDIDRMFASCFVKGKPMYFCPENFSDFNHYVKIMGLDKPIDLKLGDSRSKVEVLTEDSKQKK